MSQSIHSKFRKIREALDMNQNDFALAVGISPSYVSLIESGGKVPAGPLVELVRTKFGVNAVWWTTGEGEVLKKEEPKPAKGSLEALVQELIGSEMDKLPTNGEKFDLAADLREFLRHRRGQ